jgi:3-dehydroquinate dehydratase-2
MTKMLDILVLHGPNLNLLGRREPHLYGHNSLADIDQQLFAQAGAQSRTLETFQSQSESALIERIHRALDEQVKFIVINPAAFTHTSVALRDALLAVNIPFVEVHLSNVYKREDFRAKSFFSDVAVGVISGLGAQSYLLALEFVLSQLGLQSENLS